MRAWIDGRVGFAYGTDLSDDGVAAIAADAVEAARVSDPDEFAAAPQPSTDAAPAADGYLDPETARLGDRPQGRAGEGRSSARRSMADPRVVAVETDRLRRRGGELGDPLLHRARRLLSRPASPTPTCRRSPSRTAPSRPGSASASAARPPPWTRRRSGARAPSARCSCSAPPSRRRAPARWSSTRRSPPASPGSSAACSAPTRSSAGARRSPIGSVTRSPPTSLAVADDGIDLEGMASAPIDAEGLPRGRTPLIEGGRSPPTCTTPTRPAARATASARPPTPSRSGYRSAPSVSTSNLIVEPGRQQPRRAARRRRRRGLRHRRRRPSLGRQPRLRPVLGRRLRRPHLRRRARRPGDRVHDRLRPRLDALGRSRRRLRGPLGALRRLGQDPAAADRRDGGGGQLTRTAAICGRRHRARGRPGIRSRRVRPSARRVRYPGWPHRQERAPRARSRRPLGPSAAGGRARLGRGCPSAG